MSNTARKKPAPSPRRVARGAGGKFTSTKKSRPVEPEVDELEGSAVSVEEVDEEPEEETEVQEVEEDLDDEDAEEYDEEEDEEGEEDEEEEDEEYDEDEEEEEDEKLSPEAQAAIAAEMEKSSEPEPVKMKRLSIVDIERAQDITEEEFFVEEWAGTVLLRSPSARKLIKMVKDSGQGNLTVEDGQASVDDVDFETMLKELVQMSVVDPVIDDEAYEMILDKSGGALFSIFGKVREIAKLDRIGSNGKKIDAVKEEEKRFRKG